MLRSTLLARKNPVLLKFGVGVVKDQLDHLLNKKPLHHFDWDPVPEYPARKLRHADRKLDPRTGAALPDPARDFGLSSSTSSSDVQNRSYLVPDQQYLRVPVPQRYKDAYWWREQQARRTQKPVAWEAHKFWSVDKRHRYNFADLSFEKKFWFSVDDVVAHARQERR